MRLFLIYNVCVDPSPARGQRLGSKLLQVVIEEWKRKREGSDVLALDVKVCNISAVRLYLSLGFKPQRCAYMEDGEQYYLMYYEPSTTITRSTRIA